MNKVMFIRKGQIVLGAFLLVAFACTGLYLKHSEHEAASAAMGTERTIQMVTGEFKATTPDGKEIEVYRWSPDTIVVRKGEKITLSIYGVNGASHSFYIEKMGVQSVVTKGKETTVSFTAQKEGTYRIICTDHPDVAHNGPMIGYIYVI